MMNINADSYNQICDLWSEYRDHMPVNKCVVDFAGILKPCCKVLDIGCGTGYPVAAYLSENGFMVTGIDISERMICLANRLSIHGAEFVVADLLSYHTNEKFDGIIAFDSLWHIPKENQGEIYRIVSELLNDGGYFLFTHGKEAGSVSGDMFGARFWYSALDVQEVHQLLKDNGFAIVTSIVDYAEDTTGNRDLLVIAKKVRSN